MEFIFKLNLTFNNQVTSRTAYSSYSKVIYLYDMDSLPFPISNSYLPRLNVQAYP